MYVKVICANYEKNFFETNSIDVYKIKIEITTRHLVFSLRYNPNSQK